MNTEVLLNEIKSGLTGNAEADMLYLSEKTQEYKEEECGVEIGKFCLELMRKIAVDKKKKENQKQNEDTVNSIMSGLEEVKYYEQNMESDLAMGKIELLIEKLKVLEAQGRFEEDRERIYFNFRDAFEYVLYTYRNKPLKQVVGLPIPFAAVYMEYGKLLMEQKRFDEAKRALEIALKWNPARAEIALKYAEVFLAEGQLEDYLSMSLENFQLAYTTKDLAKCYSNLGAYFLEKKYWKISATCYTLSLRYDAFDDRANNAMRYINETADPGYADVEETHIAAFSQQFGFPVGADREICGLLFDNGKACFEKGDKRKALYFLRLLDRLEDNSSVKELLNALAD